MLNSSITAAPPATPASSSARLGRMLLWLLAGVLLVAFIGRPALERTQEARVLVVAREMLGGGWKAWLIPHANGQLRLQKPPLAYWMSAGCYKLLGVSEGAGRLPSALAGWLTVGVTYLAGSWLLGRRGGLLAALVLLSGYIFFRHARLAETDVLVTLCVTAASYALWRGLGEKGIRQVAFYQLGGIAIGLAVLAKGPPAAFPVIFFLALVLIERRWDGGGRFLISGAIFTAALIGWPWWYLAKSLSAGTFGKEVGDLLEGADHYSPAYMYVPFLLQATAPWTGFAVAGIVVAIGRIRRDPIARGLLLWAASILVPLCFVGNKQIHYTLPMLPPLALLAAWMIDQAIEELRTHRVVRGTPGPAGASAAGQPIQLEYVSAGIRTVTPVRPLAPLVRILLIATLAISALGVAGILVGAWKERGHHIARIDAAMAISVGLGVAIAVLMYVRRGLLAGLIAYGAACAALLPLLVGVWRPSLEATTSRTIAAAIREVGPGPYCFYGQRDSLTLCFGLRSVIPLYHDPSELLVASRRHPEMVVITQEGKRDNVPPPLPAGFVNRADIPWEKQVIRVWTREAESRPAD